MVDLPPIGKGGYAKYDDRKYIGAFLTLFALARTKDTDILTPELLKAIEVMYIGVSKEWVDSSGVWDSTRPLICFTQDAIIGLIRYSLDLGVEDFKINEIQLKRVLRDVLTADKTIDLIASSLIDKFRDINDESLADKFKNLEKKINKK
jgi:hypothetical protein